MPDTQDQQSGDTGEGDSPPQIQKEKTEPPKHVFIGLNEDADVIETRNGD